MPRSFCFGISIRFLSFFRFVPSFASSFSFFFGTFVILHRLPLTYVCPFYQISRSLFEQRQPHLDHRHHCKHLILGRPHSPAHSLPLIASVIITNLASPLSTFDIQFNLKISSRPSQATSASVVVVCPPLPHLHLSYRYRTSHLLSASHSSYPVTSASSHVELFSVSIGLPRARSPTFILTLSLFLYSHSTWYSLIDLIPPFD